MPGGSSQESALEIVAVEPTSAAGQACLRAYYAELDERFDSGFDVDVALPADMDPLLVVRADGEPIGCGGLVWHGDVPDIKRMWVAGSARGRGVGRQLLAALEGRALEGGAKRVRLETNSSLVEAIAMYRSSGYVEVDPFNDEPYAHHWFEKRLSPYVITLHDPKDDTDEEIAEWVAFGNELQAEVLPDESPTLVTDAIAQVRATPRRYQQWSFRARDAIGTLVGTARCNLDPEHDDDPDLLFLNVAIHRDHRGCGLARRLLGQLIEVAETEARTRVVGWTNELRPEAAAFAEAVGARVVTRNHANRLFTEKVDRTQLDGWIRDAATRSTDYELIGWDGPVPDEHMDRWLQLALVLNDMPHDDLVINDFTLTEEEVRENEDVAAALGAEEWMLVARHAGTGEWAGYHDVIWFPTDPKIVWVGSTAVDRAHRGHALGKWLKAVMTLRILDERPEVTEIRTGNADSNDAMLGINHAMGYEPWMAQSMWEVSTADARRYVDGAT
jgi:GNAT superfamily N-acetyltransferase